MSDANEEVPAEEVAEEEVVEEEVAEMNVLDALKEVCFCWKYHMAVSSVGSAPRYGLGLSTL